MRYPFCDEWHILCSASFPIASVGIIAELAQHAYIDPDSTGGYLLSPDKTAVAGRPLRAEI